MIYKTQPIIHPKLPGTSIYPLGDQKLVQGKRQQVLVVMEPNAEIPLHTHRVDAMMDPVAGFAIVLSDNEDNGVLVQPGQRVEFAAHGPHGFRAGTEGFSFVSTNDGIVDAAGEWDIQL